MDKVFCIIVNYNSQQWIARTMQSIEQSIHPLQVVVVDNGSTDGSLEWLQKNYPQLIYHQTKSNLGFGKANNIGISLALQNGADYVFLQNQDVYLHPDTITKLIDVVKESTNYAILSPMHYNGRGVGLDYWFSTYMSPPTCKGLVSDITTNQPLKKVYATKMVNAAAWLISKEHLKMVGGFHPAFFHYGEDSNYCERVLYLGVKIGIVPNAIIYHDRDYRPINKFESDKTLKLEREFLKLTSYPNKVNFKWNNYFKWFLGILFHLLSGKLLKVKALFFKLNKWYRFPLSTVNKYNKQFKSGAYSYLNFKE
ncbi:MAG: glycosyltransferase family 2 protein [Flavobacterium sp.]